MTRLLTSGAVDAARAEAEPAVLEVYEAVQDGDAARAAQCAGKLDLAQRRACGDLLKKLRAANRGVWLWEYRSRLGALAVAGAACQTGAAATAAWLAARDFRWVELPEAVLLDVLADRAPGWLADVAHRLAERPRSADVSYALMAGLVRLSGCAAPTTEAYVHGWIFWHFHRRPSTFGPQVSLVEALRDDRDLAALVQAVFVTPDVGGYAQFTFPGEQGQNTWHEALALLTREGRLDRTAMVGSCVARLLRGGSKADERWFLRLLDELSPTREERLRHLADWCALAADANSPVAARAQAVLGDLALDADGGLSDARLADVTRAVLFRTEKKLVRAQLVLLGKVLKARPEAAEVLLPSVTEAFGHPDTDVQERALKLIGRHTGSLDRLQLAELATAADLLSPGLRTLAAEILGQPVGDDDSTFVYEEFLPPVPEPAPFTAAGAQPAEVAEDVGVILAGAANDPLTFERALDGLMRHACRDRAALAEALRPVVAAHGWWEHISSWIRRGDYYFNVRANGIEVAVGALLGELPLATVHRELQQVSSGAKAPQGAPAAIRIARCFEAAYRICTDPAPCLLAAPTDSSGRIEATVLVERLEEYARLGARVGKMDFGQALLRVSFDSPADAATLGAAAERASALGTSHGDRLAEHLRRGVPQAPAARRELREVYCSDLIDRVVVDLGEIPWLQEHFSGPFALLGHPRAANGADRSPLLHFRHLLAVLPAQPELVAARLLYFMSGVAYNDYPCQEGYLPALAEAPGPAGAAVHLSVAYGLAARRPQDRLEAVDALLLLAARGTLDTGRLGTDIAELCTLGGITPGRVAAGLRTTAETGAYATTWAVLRAALPGLLGAEGIGAKALGDFLETGAECVERCGARGEIPGLAERAGQSGTSRVQRQARRLRDALSGQPL